MYLNFARLYPPVDLVAHGAVDGRQINEKGVVFVVQVSI